MGKELWELEKKYGELMKKESVQEYMRLVGKLRHLNSEYFFEEGQEVKEMLAEMIEAVERKIREVKKNPDVQEFIKVYDALVPLWMKKASERFVKTAKKCKAGKNQPFFMRDKP